MNKNNNNYIPSQNLDLDNKLTHTYDSLSAYTSSSNSVSKVINILSVAIIRLELKKLKNNIMNSSSIKFDSDSEFDSEFGINSVYSHSSNKNTNNSR